MLVVSQGLVRGTLPREHVDFGIARLEQKRKGNRRNVGSFVTLLKWVGARCETPI